MDWRIAVAQAVFVSAVAFVVGRQAIGGGALPDFAMFWGAHHIASPYDWRALTRLLNSDTAIFPYPPTFVLLTEPLAWLPMVTAYYVWVALSLSAVVLALRRLEAPIVLIAPAVFMAGVSGQTSLVIGAALFACVTLPSRPWLAGVLLGIAACIKPQAVVLAPVVLLATGQWRVLAAAAVTGFALVCAATLAYGWRIWLDWLHLLPTVVSSTDAAFTGRLLALPGWWKLVAVAVGLAGSWIAARRGQPRLAMTVAVAATLLGSLHSLDYDVAILAPFALSAVLCGGWIALGYAAALIAPPSAWSVLAIGALAIVDIGWGSYLRGRWPLRRSKQNENMI